MPTLMGAGTHQRGLVLNPSDRSQQSIAARRVLKRGVEVPKGTGSLDGQDLYVSEPSHAQLA